MQLAAKIRKAATLAAYESARKHAGRILFSRHRGFPLTAEHLRADLETDAFRALRERYGTNEPTLDFPKYFDTEKWIAVNLERVIELELDFGPRRRILDLGCGFGYFLYLCQRLGHDCVGLDDMSVPMFGEVTQVLGVKRTVWHIEAYVPLPDLGSKFDLVTAFLICFNGHKEDTLWGPAEWEFFLNDLGRQVQPGGRVVLGFNRERNQLRYTPELRAFFNRRGAQFDRLGRIRLTIS